MNELAQIAQQWAVAEKGGQAPSRLVLSGHHVGSGVYGENNGRLDWPTVGALAEAMPHGAKSVEDLLIAGCYSGGQNMMEKYTAMFPGAKTIVAYDGSSPGAASGATAHQKAWERSTRGSGEGITRELFQGMRKGENVTVWTKTRGFDDGKPRATVDELKQRPHRARVGLQRRVGRRRDSRHPARAGARLLQRDPAPHSAPRHHAHRAQDPRGAARPDDSPHLHGPVSARFQETYGSKLSAGYQALGLPAPDFKSMNRAQALASIQQFEAKLAATPAAGEAATKLAPILRDFAELKSSLIPDTWI